MDRDEIIELSGAKKGPTSIILAGTHGDEMCGVQILDKILPSLEIEKGRVFFGFGNPMAIKNNTRFTEANLNRMFKDDGLLSAKEKASYEYKRAGFLKKYLDHAGALLDVHASFVAISRPFIICEPNGFNIAKNFPFDLVVSGFDKVQPGGTDYYMTKVGGIGICVECGFLGDLSSTRRAEQSISAFLAARKHVAGVVKPYPKSFINVYSLYFTKTDKFRLALPFEDFEDVFAGQLIGMDGNQEVCASKDSLILFAADQDQANEEGFLLAKKVPMGKTKR